MLIIEKLKDRLRHRLNAPVLAELDELRFKVTLDAVRATGWDGTPANLVARKNALEEVIEIVERDRA